MYRKPIPKDKDRNKRVTKGNPSHTEYSSAVERTAWDREAARAALAILTMNKYKDFLEENIIWPIERLWDDLTNIPNEIKWLWQRGKRGWADEDIWSLDWYLSSWLPAAFRKLAKDAHGCPGDLFDKKNKKNQCHKWHKILEEMALGFEAYCKFEEYMGNDYAKEYKKMKKLRDRSFDLMKEYWGNLWD